MSAAQLFSMIFFINKLILCAMQPNYIVNLISIVFYCENYKNKNLKLILPMKITSGYFLFKIS
jgi:hypothetical protein